MGHVVYRAINKPTMWLGIEWRLLLGCFVSTVACFYGTRQSYLCAAIWAVASYTACRKWTKKGVFYPLLLLDNYRRKKILDPMARSTKPRIVIHGD